MSQQDYEREEDTIFKEFYKNIPTLTDEQVDELYGFDPETYTPTPSHSSNEELNELLQNILKGKYPTLEECIPKNTFIELIDRVT